MKKQNWPWFSGAAIILVLIVASLLGGCQAASFSEGDYTGQGLQATYNKTGSAGYAVITYDDGSVVVVPLGSNPTTVPPQK